MRKQMWRIMVVTLALVGAVAAQHTQGAKMDHDMMSAMHGSPQHSMMVAHHKNVENFAQALADMSAGGKLEDVELAQSALSEIKDSVAKMKDIHQSHQSKMTPEMREHMKSMMEKMQKETTSMMEQLQQLDNALSAPEPRAAEVHKLASALVQRMDNMKKSDMKKMDKMNKSDMKMKMPATKP
ncbi:MAG TPA: hypothetical protein VFZ49_10690 [Pyrinomonadaceae bacterium]